MSAVYLTSPLFYVNAEPHLGSTYTMMITDTLARYYRGKGAETFFLTGTDEHGDKIAQAAAEAESFRKRIYRPGQRGVSPHLGRLRHHLRSLHSHHR